MMECSDTTGCDGIAWLEGSSLCQLCMFSGAFPWRNAQNYTSTYAGSIVVWKPWWHQEYRLDSAFEVSQPVIATSSAHFNLDLYCDTIMIHVSPINGDACVANISVSTRLWGGIRVPITPPSDGWVRDQWQRIFVPIQPQRNDSFSWDKLGRLRISATHATKPSMSTTLMVRDVRIQSASGSMRQDGRIVLPGNGMFTAGNAKCLAVENM